MNTKTITATLMLLLALVGLTANAQTNVVTVTNYVTITNYTTASALENAEAAKGLPMEFTFGAAGMTVPKTGETTFGLDFTLSVQPLKQPIWFGIAQGLAWEPSLSGSTDLYADWSWRIYKEKLYLNTGWSVGALYDRNTLGWRSGPEISLEYYTSGNAFIYVGANYDLFTRDSAGTWHTAEGSSGLNNLRYSAGIGIAF
jgi:hypothetical protein